MRRALQAFRSTYGASPLQLVGLLLSLLVALVAARHVYQADPKYWWRYAIWFVGAAIGHDLLLFPAYTALDRALQLVPHRRMAAGTVNFVRVPAVLSGFLLLAFLPAITRGGEAGFRFAGDQDQSGILLHWVLVTVVLFAVSAALYVARRLRS
jgi:hypothetical protein